MRINTELTTDKIGKAICLAVYITAVAVLSCFHELWLDEIHPWEMDTNMSFGEVIGCMAGEGHFATWHLLLMPLAKLGASAVWGMPLVSLLVMGLGAWWLLYRSDFSLVAKFCILFSAPSLYFFSVMCRVYAIIPLVLWLVAYYHQRRATSPVAYGVSLGLLFNTHMYMEGLAITLFLYWAYEVYRDHSWSGPDSGRRRQIYGLTIAALMALLAFAQIAGNFFMPETVAYKRLSTAHQLLIEFPDRYMSLVYILASKIFGSFMPGWLISALLLAGFGIVYYRLLRGSRAALVIVAIAILFQVVFAMCIYFFDGQRFYLPFYIMIFGLWIGGKASKRATTWFIATLFLLNINIEYSAVKDDVDNTFEIFKDTADEYNRDTSDVRFINWESMMVRIVTSCYGQNPETAVKFEDESVIYNILETSSPESFSVYGANQPWENPVKITDYRPLCDSITSMGYTVEYTEYPFLRIPGCFVVVKGHR